MTTLPILLRFCVQFMQMGVKVKIIQISTRVAFIYGFPESHNLSLIFFQPSQSGANDLTGVRVAASADAGLDEFVKMGAQSNGCSFHNFLIFRKHKKYSYVNQIYLLFSINTGIFECRLVEVDGKWIVNIIDYETNRLAFPAFVRGSLDIFLYAR